MGWGTERPGEEFGFALFILENPLSKAALLSLGEEGAQGNSPHPRRGLLGTGISQCGNSRRKSNQL